MGKKRLLDNVESQLGELDRERSEVIAHSVMYHLWRRMPFHERQRVLGVLGPDLRELLMEPKSPREPRASDEEMRTEGAIAYDSYDDFCGEIREETQLAGDGEDVKAIRAVFGALKDELPSDEIIFIEERLPKGLNQAWAIA